MAKAKKLAANEECARKSMSYEPGGADAKTADGDDSGAARSLRGKVSAFFAEPLVMQGIGMVRTVPTSHVAQCTVCVCRETSSL